MSKKIQIKDAKIVSNRRIKGNYFKLVINAPEVAKDCLPGQFLHIRISYKSDPLLRRPFSVHRVIDNKKHIEILYEAVGKTTEILSSMHPRQKVNILGPLGKGFEVKDKAPAILIAGGIGVAPLAFLAAKIAGSKSKTKGLPILVLLGAKTKNTLLCKDDFKKLGCDIKVATDDGSMGFKGNVNDLLKKLLADKKLRSSGIYACGPEAMYRGLSSISKRYNIPTQVSLEAYMACGVGICLGCAVNTTDGYKLACKDGPVFNIRDIVW